MCREVLTMKMLNDHGAVQAANLNRTYFLTQTWTRHTTFYTFESPATHHDLLLLWCWVFSNSTWCPPAWKNESTLSKALARYPACRQIFPARLWKQLSGTLPPSNSQYPFSQNRDQGVMSMCGDCKVRKGQTSCFSCILQTFSHWNLFWFHWKTSEQTRYSRRHRILRKTARMHSTSPIRQGKAIVLRCEKTSDQLLCLWIWLHPPANSVWPWETVRQKDTLMHSLLQLPLSKSFHQWNHKYDHRWNKKCTYRPVLVTPSNMLEATV